MAGRLKHWQRTLAARQADVARRTKQAQHARKRAVAARGGPQATQEAKRYTDAQRRLHSSEEAVTAAYAAVKKLSKKKLRVRAYEVAKSLIGVMEEGSNNAGQKVSEIIHENQGSGPEPWCGDFVAYCYRHAGSKRVTRSWASVALLRGVLGIRQVKHPEEGDLVRFSFQGPGSASHVGIFVKDLGMGRIQTIEGNTGAIGAVSDSSTGGDGVYRKERSKGLVLDYLRVMG